MLHAAFGVRSCLTEGFAQSGEPMATDGWGDDDAKGGGDDWGTGGGGAEWGADSAAPAIGTVDDDTR